jgi:BirA family biotin operon repressor/biotin-[acetyl-CoA-carboxylase] ligase
MNSIVDQAIINTPITNLAGEYELTRAPLREESIRQHLREHLHDLGLDSICKIHVLSSVTSTNDYLLEHELGCEQFAVCVAEKQTQGRGRYGHQWVSPVSANLYLSMSWPLQAAPEQPGKSNKLDALCLWLLIAIVELLEQQGCADIQLKWPNDLCVQNKKLAGVLIERKVGPARTNLVIGVGLNLAMPSNEGAAIETPWIDLLSILPDWRLSRNELAAKVVTVFYKTLQKFEANQLKGLDSKWKTYDMLCNKKVEFLQDGGIKTGHAKGIDNSGLIILDIEGEAESEHLHSAHISEIKVIGNEK